MIHIKSEGKDGLSAIIQLAPGTHHLKFLVDGDMRTADHLPTAVDFTNVLVNYIEVRADEPSPPQAPTAAPGPSKPIDIKRARPRPFPPPGLHPPQVLPPTPTEGYYHYDDGDDDHADESLDTARPGRTPEDNRSLHGPDSHHPQGRTTRDGPKDAEDEDKLDMELAKKLLPDILRTWTTTIPRYLRDLDAQEGTSAQQRITRAMTKMPPPPGLPGFLGKSILNGTTPMKDDSSVLNMPNHTVLNHLATSSIKDAVLATSVTTRYQNKYLTTIMYKPIDGKD